MLRSFYLLIILLVSLSAAADGVDTSRLGWLVGHWKGDGFGGTSEEIWSPAEDGVMMGMFRHHNADGTLNFYEFLTIDETGLRLKHFNPDMTSWEEKNDFVSFGFKSQSDSRIEFNGLVFEHQGDSRMQISLRMKRGDEIHTEVFNMRRVKSIHP